MKNKKVLIVLQYLEPGGIEWMVARFSESLLKGTSKWRPFVMVYDQGLAEPIDSFFHSRNIPLFRIQKNEGFSLKVVFSILNLIWKERIEVIHVHHLGALIYAVIAKVLCFFQIKIIYTQHSFIHLKKIPRYQKLEKIFCHFADRITAVSEQVQREFKEYKIHQGAVDLIPNGSLFPNRVLCDKDKRQRERTVLITKEGLQERLSAQVNKNWILYLARIHSGKGQDTAIELWNQCSEHQRENSLLIFVGPILDKDFFQTLKKLIEKAQSSSQIYILPASMNSIDWMRVSDVFLSCSESEGWPIAPLEALGAGVPVLLSQIEGHEMYKKYCHLFDLKNLKEAATAIEKILDQNFDAMRNQQWLKTEELRQKYSVETMALRYSKIYDQMFS